MSILVPLFSISSTCNSISFGDLSSIYSFRLLISPSLPLGIRRFGVVFEKLLFSSVMLKTECVALKLVTGDSHLPS